MCDTLVIMPKATKDGSLIFAKNADRDANEPLVTVRYPAKKNDLKKEPMVQLTYIAVPQVEETYEVVLLKPSWIWGAEIGFNEHGLNIGNEAVFTKEKKGKESLIGMDFLRLALERTKTAKDALDLIISLLQEYGQGGNCGYEKNFYYHNAFLIADKEKAFVLETAGRFYAIKEVDDFYAISNCLSLEDNYTSLHPDTIDNAKEKKYFKEGETFKFAKSYSDLIFSHFAKGRQRRSKAMKILERDKGKATIFTAMEVLRSHSDSKKEDGSSVSSVCMHAGGLIGDHTTGSYVAKLTKDEELYYVTGTSLACQSIFKPTIRSEKMPIAQEDENLGRKYWVGAEKVMRYVLSGQIDKAEYIEKRDQLEKKYIDLFENAKTKEEKEKIMFESYEAEQKFFKNYLEKLNGAKHVFKKGSFLYRQYWTKKTKRLEEKNKDVY